MDFKRWIKTHTFVLIANIILLIVFIVSIDYLVRFFDHYSIGNHSILYPIVFILTYVVFYTLILGILHLFPKNNYAKIAEKTLFSTFSFFNFLEPLIVFLITIIFIFIPPVVIVLMILLLANFLDYKIPLPLITYISLTLFSISIVLNGEDRVRKINDKYLKYIDHYNWEKQLDLSLGIINNNNLRYLNYCLYFIILIVISILDLSNINILNIENLNKAIMQSFVTFIAFDRVMRNKKLFSIDTKSILSKLVDIWTYQSKNKKP